MKLNTNAGLEKDLILSDSVFVFFIPILVDGLSEIPIAGSFISFAYIVGDIYFTTKYGSTLAHYIAYLATCSYYFWSILSACFSQIVDAGFIGDSPSVLDDRNSNMIPR